MRKWSRTEKIAGWSLVVTVLTLAVAVAIPEIRRWIGLDKPNPVPTAPVVETKKESPPLPAPEPQNPKPKKPSVPRQTAKVKVKGNNDVAGNNTSGNNNAVGNNNTVTAPSTTITIPGSGNGVSVGQQGGITAGTIILGPPPPKLTWEPVDGQGDPNTKPEHPRAYVRIYLDRSLPDAKFGIFCDRPCKAAFHSSVAGMNADKTLESKEIPAFAGEWILAPNPFPADTDYVLGVESRDDQPVVIKDVRILNLTEEQKKALREEQRAPH
jgi:hypothetical protein